MQTTDIIFISELQKSAKRAVRHRAPSDRRSASQRALIETRVRATA
jgi:hypothetical protein